MKHVMKHLMTVIINMHKPYFIFMTYVMSWLLKCHPVVCTPLQVKFYPTALYEK